MNDRIEGTRVVDATPLVLLTWALSPVALAVLVTETLRITEMHGTEELEGVHVADMTPLVALIGAALTPPVSLVRHERLRIADKLVRVRRVRPRL